MQTNTLFEHQKRIISEDPKKCGLWLGTGSSKTRIALELAQGKILVVAPKTQVEDRNWQRENNKWDINKNITVISKETFRRDHEKLPRFDTVIVDEAHTVLGVTPNIRSRKKVLIPKASQLFEALEAYLERTDPQRLYLCTATIMKSPFTVWAARKIIRREKFDIQDFYNFRYEYYTKLPMPGREVWSPKRSEICKENLSKIVRRIGFVGRLEDYFDVPEQTFRTINIELTEAQKARIKELKFEYPEPLVRIGKRHQIENGVLAGDEFSPPEFFPNKKIEKILELAEEFPKMIVFAKYRAQMEQIVTALDKEGYRTAFLHGGVTDRGGLIEYVKNHDECIFVVQAQISAGWEVPNCPVMVFASRTYSFVDYDQALGRIQRANHIKKNLYINLVVKGGIDEAVDKALLNKQDFNEHLYGERT